MRGMGGTERPWTDTTVTPAGNPIPGWDGEISPDGGDVGGDVQDGPAWVRRWVEANPDSGLPYQRTFTVIDFYAFRVATPESWSGGEEAGRHGMSLMVCYSHCTDLNDVGGSEMYSNNAFWDGVIEPDHGDPEGVLKSLGLDDIEAAHDQMGQ